MGHNLAKIRTKASVQSPENTRTVFYWKNSTKRRIKVGKVLSKVNYYGLLERMKRNINSVKKANISHRNKSSSVTQNRKIECGTEDIGRTQQIYTMFLSWNSYGFAS